jgi:hypothetical protein
MPIGIPIGHTHDMHSANRVAKVNLAFWIMKICATTVGETAGDMLSMTLNIGYALSSILLIGFFIVTLIAQMRSKTFQPVPLLGGHPRDEHGGHDDVGTTWIARSSSATRWARRSSRPCS